MRSMQLLIYDVNTDKTGASKEIKAVTEKDENSEQLQQKNQQL